VISLVNLTLMSAGFRITPVLWDKIHHFASFPQTGGMFAFLLTFGITIFELPKFPCSRWSFSVKILVRERY
jgi:hypothetical protein